MQTYDPHLGGALQTGQHASRQSKSLRFGAPHPNPLPLIGFPIVWLCREIVSIGLLCTQVRGLHKADSPWILKSPKQAILCYKKFFLIKA
jgi:hypothetical protein